MCYLTYYPIDSHTTVFTSNRDEQTHRNDPAIAIESTPAGSLYYPRVPSIVGSWLVARTDGTIAVLLNGAFLAHTRQPPYRLSRGTVLRQVFDYQDFETFCNDSDFHQIEPFTIVYKHGQLAHHFWELRWDGAQKHLRQLNPALPQSWSSATLYTPELQHARDTWYQNWRAAQTAITPQSLLTFQTAATHDDTRNDLLMSRPELNLCTVSVTQVTIEEHQQTFFYHNLLTNQQERRTFTAETSSV